jgi:D-3-phosphoglycerate dehydrogenase / 2-oxoglutarate reductase
VRAVFVDANATLGGLFERLGQGNAAQMTVHLQAEVAPEELPGILAGAQVAIVDHSAVPTEIARQCTGLTDIVFLGTGARSYMDPEALAEIGITVHIIKGYGDTAVAECAFALMWASAKRFGVMDRAMRAGQWLRSDAIQLRGKTLGLIGFGGIARELARMALGIGMEVIAWNRSPLAHPGVSFVDIDDLLDRSDVVSLHLLLNDQTRGFLSRARIDRLRDGAILVNTARGALVDEDALVDALRSGRLHAGLDVFATEPLPPGHPLGALPNVVLSAHSAFRTPEASVNLVEAALAHCDRIAKASKGQGMTPPPASGTSPRP